MHSALLEQLGADTSEFGFVVKCTDEDEYADSDLGEGQAEEARPTTDDAATNAGCVVPFPTNLRESIEVLKEIACYGENWDSYGSCPIEEDVLCTAKELLFSLEPAMPSPTVVPVSGGGIQLEWQVDGRELEIEFHPDSTIEFLKVNEDETMEEGEIPAGDSVHLSHLLKWLSADQRTCETN